MRLFNQTKNALSWRMSGQQFEAEPWGPVEVPDGLAASCKSRGLPLDVAPVPPESRAQQRIVDEKEAEDQNALRALKKSADDWEAKFRAAQSELEAVQLTMSQERERASKLEKKLGETRDACARAVEDKKAAEDLLSEMSKRAEDCETRAIKAEATLQEMRSAKKPAKSESRQARESG